MRMIIRHVTLIAVLASSGCGPSLVTENIDPSGFTGPNTERPAIFDGAYIEYFLPRAEMKITAKYNKDTGLVSVETDGKPKVVADFDRPFRLVYRHSQLSNDKINIDIADGLLKTISSTTKDQTVELIKSTTALVTQFGALQEARRQAGVAKETIQEEDTPCSESLITEVILDLTYQKAKRVDKLWGTSCYLELIIDGEVVEKKAVDINHRRSINSGVFSDHGRDRNERDIYDICNNHVCFRNTAAFRLNVTASLKYNNDYKNLGSEYKNKEFEISPEYNDKKFKNVIIINKKPYLFQNTVEVIAPISNSIGLINFKRRAFVENATTVTFTDGMLTGIKTDDPSELVGFLLLPTEVLKFFTILVKLD